MRRNPASAPAPHCSAELRPDAAFLLCRPPETSRPFPAVSRASFGNPASERPAGSLTEGLRKKCINHLRPCRLPRTDVFPFFSRITTSPRHHATTPRHPDVTTSRHPDTPPSAIPAFSPLSPSIFPFRVRPRLRTASVSASVPFPSPHRSLTTPPSSLPPPRRCATLPKCGIFPPLPLTPAAGTLKHTGTLRAGCKSPPAVNPLARGSPRARFQGKSADPVQVRGRR